jgi:hypothetical protein
MGMGSLIGAGISGVSSIFGASQQASASKKAAAIQAQVAREAMQIQKDQFQQTQNNLAPYLATGGAASGMLGNRLGELTSDVPLPDMLTKPLTQAELEATPGYQFTLSQGLKATQNSAAARGLGLSGAALKGAATFATGLSDQTYNTRFNQNQIQGTNIFNALTQNKTGAYNKLIGVAGMGAGAATGQGQIGAATANNMGNALIGAGNAEAAGINGAAAAWTSGLNGASNALTGGLNNWLMFNKLQGGSGVGGLFSDAAGASWT